MVVLVSGVTGILISQFLLPWLAAREPFSRWGWFYWAKDGVTIINKTEKIYLTQDLAYQEALAKIAPAVVAIRAERSKKVLAQWSGFLVTSDGLVATIDLAAARGATQWVVLRGNEELEAEIWQQDKTNGLLILKIAATNWPVVSFGETAALRLGEMVLLAGAAVESEAINQVANVGFVKKISPDFSFTFSETALMNGSPIINIKGEVLGAALVAKTGEVTLLGAAKIKELLK